MLEGVGALALTRIKHPQPKPPHGTFAPRPAAWHVTHRRITPKLSVPTGPTTRLWNMGRSVKG
jgi:hypothetical protein